jgi:hypothetical protein
MSTRQPDWLPSINQRQIQHVMGNSISSSIGLVRPNHALQRIGAKHFGLMSHWFYIMLGFGKAAQIQEGNENVV